MTEQARVLFSAKEYVTLSCTDDGSCASCAGKGFCNVQGKQYTAVNSRNLELKPGDDVEVYLPPGKTIFSGFMVMMVPLLLFVLGYILASSFFEAGNDLLHALGGFIGLALGFLIAYGYGKQQKSRSQPEILRVIKKHSG